MLYDVILRRLCLGTVVLKDHYESREKRDENENKNEPAIQTSR